MQTTCLVLKTVISVTYIVILNTVTCLAADPRIIGGTSVTNRSEFAFQALLLLDNRFYCGGAIIDEKHVLTAAHCSVLEDLSVIRASRVSVGVGNLDLTSPTTVMKVTDLFIHEDYNGKTFYNDIAVWRVSGTFDNTTENIKPIDLQTAEVPIGSACNVSGWGTTISGVQASVSRNLLYVEVPVVSTQSCNIYYGGITKNQLCAGEEGKDSCQGDSGGPLVCSGKLTGIVSNGYECGLKNYPGIYTKVAKYLDWIEVQKHRPSNAKRTVMSLLSVITPIIIVVYFL